MIQHPAVMALLLSSFLITAMSLYASWYGIRILLHWDISSGSELQLSLERRTYLISTILGYSLFFQILSFFLLIYTTDSIHNLFTGAMCAAGSLGANGYGYPLLLLKLTNTLFAGVWLTINHLDSRGYDYPLIRRKYLLLLCLTVLLTALVTALLLNTSMAVSSHRVHVQQIELSQLRETEAELQARLDSLGSPSELRQRARSLGMVPAEATVYISVGTRSIVSAEEGK